MISFYWIAFLFGLFFAMKIHVEYYTASQRSHTAGNDVIESSVERNRDQYTFLNASNEYFEFQVLVRGNGPCGHSGRIADDVFSRPCTPVFHFHEDQVEIFTVLEGEMGYTMETNEPKDLFLLPSDSPLRIAQGIGHTFWNQNKEEDLRVLVRVEPPSPLNRRFFETITGLQRDGLDNLLQMFVVLEDARTYPASPPRFIAKLLVKMGAFIGRFYGYRPYYSAYS